MRQFDQYDTAQDEFDQEYLQNVLGAQPVQPAAPAAQPIAQVVSPDVAAPFVEPDYGQMMFGYGQDASLGNTPLGIGRSAAVDALLGGGWSNSTDFEQYVTSGNGQDVYTGPMVGRDNPDYVPFDVSQASGKAQQRISPTQYAEQSYGPGGKLAGDVVIKDYPKENPIFGLLINAGMAGVLGPLAGTLGAAVNTGLGLGLGSFGTTALGTALVNAGKTAAGGGDLGDSLKAGLTSGATSYLGSTIGDVLPKGVAPTGIKSLDTALTKGMQSAAGSGVTSLLTGNKNILQDALTAGAGAAAGSGVNSVISDAAGSTGLPPAVLNILGPAAIAELTGGDGTTAALKAAVGELGGAIKGSSPSAKAGAVGASSPTSQELNQLFDDGSSLDVTKKGGVSSTDTDDQYYVPGSNPFLQKNLDAAATEAEQAQLLSFANQAANPNLRQNVLRDMRQEDKDYIERSLAEGGTPQQIINAYIKQEKSPEDAARMVNAIAGPTSLSTEGTVPSAKFEDAEDFTALPGKFEPSSGDLNKVLQNAGLVQAPVEITGQTPSDYGLDFGAFAERPEASLDAAPQKVEVTGQTPDTELRRFLEANGLTSDEAQKVLITGKDQDAGTDYNKFFELSPEETPTPKVVVQGEAPPKDTAVDDLMALLNQYDPKLVEPTTTDTQEANRVEITAKKLLQDMGLDLGAYYPSDEQTEVPTDKLTDDITQTVPITGTNVKEELDPNFFYQPDEVVLDSGLDLGAINEGPVVDDSQKVVIQKDKLKEELDPNFFYQPDEVVLDKLTDDITQTVPITGTNVKDELDPNFFYQPDEVAPDTQQVLVRDKLVDELPWEDPWIAPKDPDTQEVVIRDKLKDELPWEDPWMPPVVEETFPFIYPGEETPPEVNEPVVDPTKPVVKPVTPKVPVVTPPKTTTTPGSSYTIPGTTTQLHQELMQLPETDILRMLNPALYAYKDAQKRKKLSQEDQMTALLNELGYRS